jgi:exopolyphosphatase / guanosine-5'-triphosphate,3'-diphosphate pyrophosphatase
MRYAVIDLGTNTFHLLIVEQTNDDRVCQLAKEKSYVKLAEDGIESIGSSAFERAMQAVRRFKQLLDAYDVSAAHTRALGTAALRTADNAHLFMNEMYAETGIRAEVIQGLREAQLIYKGVRQAVPWPGGRALIMDIGGGSTEFIIADGERVFWEKSFPIGVAVLYRQFQQHDPITPNEIQTLEAFLEHRLRDLWAALNEYPCTTLIGASGTFDVIDLFVLDPVQKPELYGRIALTDFEPLCDFLLLSTLDARRQMDKMPPERAEMVVVALILVRFVLQKARIREIYTSVYAMKEGLLAELTGG